MRRDERADALLFAKHVRRRRGAQPLCKRKRLNILGHTRVFKMRVRTGKLRVELLLLVRVPGAGVSRLAHARLLRRRHSFFTWLLQYLKFILIPFAFECYFTDGGRTSANDTLYQASVTT